MGESAVQYVIYLTSGVILNPVLRTKARGNIAKRTEAYRSIGVG